MIMIIENGYAINKTNLKVQVHQSWTYSLLVAGQYFFGNAITPSSGVSEVHEYLMKSLFDKISNGSGLTSISYR